MDTQINAKPRDGQFEIYQANQLIGTSEFHWINSETYDGGSQISIGGQELRCSLRIHFAQERWQSAIYLTPAGPVELHREPGLAVAVTNSKRIEIPLPEDALLFEGFSPGLIRDLVRSYDHREGGRQAIKVLVVGQGMVEANLEHCPGDLFRLELNKVEVLIRCVAGIVEHVEIPSQQVRMILREAV